MKFIKYLLFGILLFCSSLNAQESGNAQKIIGVWQKGDDITTRNGISDNYRFYKDGTFYYSIYEEATVSIHRISSIKGTYKVYGDSIIFKIISFSERIDGEVYYEPSLGNWCYEGGKFVNREQQNSPPTTVGIKFVKENKKDIIIIDNFNKFFKISKDPDKNF